MKASFGFGEIPSVPEEEKREETLPGVRGLEDAAAEALSQEAAEKASGVSTESAEVPMAPEAGPEAQHETKVTKESLQQEVEDLERQAKELGDPELEKEAQELRAELERTPEGEREKISVGFRNVGFFVEEAKNNFFARVFKELSEAHAKLETSDVVTRKEAPTPGKKSVVGKFMGQLGKRFNEEAEKARERIETIEKTKDRETLANAGYLFGNAVKLWTITSGAVTMPLRAIAMGGMAFSRGTDAAKEVRLENEKVIEKTRIEDMNRAAEEAWKVYEAAKGRAGTKAVGVKDLEKAYREQLPKDILARLEAKTPEQPNLMNRAMQGFMKVHIERSVKRLERKTAKIEANEKLTAKEKSAKRERLFNRFDRRLHDYDRVVGQFGTVDALAMGLRYAEIGGKVATYAPAAYLGLEKGLEVIGGLFERSEVAEGLDEMRDVAASGPAAVVDSGAAPKMQSEIIQNLREHAEMPGATETAPSDALHQPYPTMDGKFGDASLLEKETITDLEEHAPSADTPKPAVLDSTKFATAPADSTLVKPSSIEQAIPAPKEIIEEAVKQEAGNKAIEVEPKVAKPSSGVMEAKMVERATPVTEEELRTLKEMKGAFEVNPEQMKLATIGKGEGVTHALMRQLKMNPSEFGYSPKSGVDLDKWAMLKSRDIAIENGYIRPDGSEVRVFDLGKGKNPAYLLDRDADGRFHVREFLGGKPSGGGKLNPYEYEWKKPSIPSEVKPIPVKSALEAVSELPARQAVEAAASGVPDELPVRGPMDVIGTKEAVAPVLERVVVGKLPETKLPEWLTERVEYAEFAERLPEMTSRVEAISDQFESYSLRTQEETLEKIASSFEKKLDYLEKHTDTLGLTPSQEDFVEMSKETIDEMREMLKESKEAFKEQLADVGVSSQSYEKAIAGKGITVKELFAMEQKSELDVKKWGAFANWLHTLKPTHEEVGMKVDDFLRSLTPENFSLKHFKEL